MKLHIDHIEPPWSEDRKYMKVCGLEVTANYCERDPELNRKKSNRFVPWRWSKDDLGVTPVEQGDLCLFLDFNTHSWVLAEFLGSWWFEQSILWGFSLTDTDYRKRQADSRRGKGWTQEMKDRMSELKKGTPSPNKGVPMTEEQKQKLRGRVFTEEHKKNLREARSRRPPATEETKQKMRAARARTHARNLLTRMSINDPLCPNFDD